MHVSKDACSGLSTGLSHSLDITLWQGDGANAVPHYQKLYSRVTHIWGNRRRQPNLSAMERPRSGASAVLITDHPEPGKYDCKRTVLLPYPTCRLNLLWRIGFSLFHNAHAVSSEEALLFKKTISRNQMSWAHFVLTRSFHLRNICIQLLTRVMPSSRDDCWSAVFDLCARTLLSAMRHIKHRRQLAAQCRIGEWE